jgi:alpha(1,3/1,4) fucosyltransferase
MEQYCLFVREDLAQLKDDFFESDTIYGMKSDLYMYTYLKQYLLSKNILLTTQWNLSPEDADIIICLNETTFFSTYKRTARNRKLVLILTEPPVYNKIDWSDDRHQNFDLIFTYDSDLVAKRPDKYVKIIFPIDFPKSKVSDFPTKEAFNSKKFSCLVAGTFSINEPDPIYNSILHERYKVIRWYHHHHPDKLNFYSRTNPLDKCRNFRGASFTNHIHKGIATIVANKIFDKNIKNVFKGAIPAADKVLFTNQYKFSFCFENTKNIKGLISEKIFECFFAKTIPIYFGAPDITDFVPKDTFIDFSTFKNLAELHHYLISMSYQDYLQYLKSAEAFLNSNQIELFTSENFSNTIVNSLNK